MKELEKHFGTINIEAVRKALQSDEYKARVEQAKKDIASMYSHMVIDRAKLFTPVDF